VFEPVSGVEYKFDKANSQSLIGTFDLEKAAATPRLRGVAAAFFIPKPGGLRDLVRDLLHNPHIRSIIFVPGLGNGVDEIVDFWTRKTELRGLLPEYAEVIRASVALYDGEYHQTGVLPPYLKGRVKWP